MRSNTTDLSVLGNMRTDLLLTCCVLADDYSPYLRSAKVKLSLLMKRLATYILNIKSINI